MQLSFTPKLEKVNVKEWGSDAKVFVKEPTAGEFAMFEHFTNVMTWKSTPSKEREEVYARIAILFAVDENGKRLFSEKQLPFLMQGSSKPLRRIAVAIQRLSELDKEEAAELEKN